jgi:Skp family chaperone for outer membrane proteins
MNKTYSIIVSIFFIALLAASSLAQTAAAPIKIVLINTDAFYDEKTGIAKLVGASKQLDTEFSARVKELQDGNTRLQGIATELQNMQKLPQAQFNQAAYTTKQDEGERLQRELNYKKNELETAVGKRRTALIGPISQDIGKAIEDFAKQKGYGAIFDVAKMADSGALLFLADAADVTKDFITFYNARPATAAAPK